MNKEFRELAHNAALRQAPQNFTIEDVNEAFRGELAKYCTSVSAFLKNRYDLFEIIVENVDAVVPQKLSKDLEMIAEVQHVKQGQKAVFKVGNRLSKMRAKKFLTQVALSGVYETFRLDTTAFELPMHAIGMGATIDFERLLDGQETLADVIDVFTESYEDAVILEVQKALRAAVNNTQMPAPNKVITATFEADRMAKLCAVVKKYSDNAIIFAPTEFIMAMGADAIVPATTAVRGIYSPQDIEAIHNTGIINLFRGVPVVELRNSFVDPNNEQTWLDPQLAYVLPAGKEKVVTVAFEGDTQIYSNTNRDNSMEIMTYKKMGVGIKSYAQFGIYKNQSIAQTMYEA